MNRKPLIAIAAFAVLGLIALFALRQPEKGEAARDFSARSPSWTPRPSTRSR